MSCGCVSAQSSTATPAARRPSAQRSVRRRIRSDRPALCRQAYRPPSKSRVAVEPGALDRPYFENSIWHVVRKRIGWLLLLFLAETLTGTVLRYFESELATVLALSFFIPLLIGTGGNAGARTVTTIVRSIALGEIRLRDGWRVLVREAGTGLVVGLLVGVVAFGRSLLWGVTLALAATVAITVLVICTWSTAIGSVIPLAARRFGVDPAVLSASLITTLVDATGLVIYFMIAKAILQL